MRNQEPFCGDHPACRLAVLTHRWDGLFPGLKSVPPRDRPPVVPPFFAFRVMVGIGPLMILAGLTGAFLW
jgi:cytochrome bd ubiquinol oxidase subunit I